MPVSTAVAPMPMPVPTGTSFPHSLKDVAADYQRLAEMQQKEQEKQTTQTLLQTPESAPQVNPTQTLTTTQARTEPTTTPIVKTEEGSPQHLLEQFLKQQGYYSEASGATNATSPKSTGHHHHHHRLITTPTPTLQDPEYSTPPTREQLASFGAYTKQVVRECSFEYKTESEEKKEEAEQTNSGQQATSSSRSLRDLRALLHCGISPNACNQFGESILHWASRHGNAAALRVLLQEYHADCQISDDYGRTVLHDACWCHDPKTERHLQVVELLLTMVTDWDARQMLFLQDKRGFLPLHYVPKDRYEEWNEWLGQNLERFFPKRNENSEDNQNTTNADKESEQDTSPGVSSQFWETCQNALSSTEAAATNIPQHSLLNKNNKNKISLELMEMVSKGKLTPQEATQLQDEDEGNEEDTYCDTECAYYDSEDEYSDYDSDDDDEETEDYTESDAVDEDDVEILEILRVAAVARSKSLTRFSLSKLVPPGEGLLAEEDIILEEEDDDDEEWE